LCRGPDDDDDDGGVVWVVLEDAFHSYPVKNSHLRTRPTSEDHAVKSLGGTGVPGLGLGLGLGLRLGLGQGTALSFSPSLPIHVAVVAGGVLNFKNWRAKRGNGAGRK